MRGEYPKPSPSSPWGLELPPRARRIHIEKIRIPRCGGTTSACAENTKTNQKGWCPTGNYLRVRGEYTGPAPHPNQAWELPPRARRIRPPRSSLAIARGTTSACAENTHPEQSVQNPGRNYLRVRGEYRDQVRSLHLQLELPPRARRIHSTSAQTILKLGTTSACAENTIFTLDIEFAYRNYLRVRGEYFNNATQLKTCRELPPRARRIPTPAMPRLFNLGTTSACAENTFPWDKPQDRDGNYLRVRGEYRSAP